MTDKKKPRTAGTGTASNTAFTSCNHTAPALTGQCAEVLWPAPGFFAGEKGGGNVE